MTETESKPRTPTWTPPDDGQERKHWCANGCGPFTFHEAVSHGIATGHGLKPERH